MTAPRNLPASIHQRLLALSRRNHEEFNLVLTRFGIERLLYRLSRSDYADRFILKGAMLFSVWASVPHRPTRDVDLLGFGSPAASDLAQTFRTICSAPVGADGVTFDVNSIRVDPIREEAIYDGLRVRLIGYLGNARIPLQIDVGFGDAAKPDPESAVFPVLLELPAPRLRVYRRETVIAEKFHAIVDLGMANSRMKDYFDLRFLSMNFAFDGSDLCLAIESTFRLRDTPILDAPVGLSPEFAFDESKRRQWSAFLRRAGVNAFEFDLKTVIDDLRAFLDPPRTSLRDGLWFSETWPPGGPWTKPVAS